jgi:hypothetical protein
LRICISRLLKIYLSVHLVFKDRRFYKKNMIKFGGANMLQSASADPNLILDPVLNSWMIPISGKLFYSENANRFQDPMHAWKPIGNGMRSSCNEVVPPLERNSVTSANDLPIKPLENIPLPYIPEELLCSLSNTMFEPKQLVDYREDSKKNNSHSRKNHKVSFY